MILIAYGTRPERIKVTPLIAEMRKRKISFKVLHVGQHPSMEENDFYIPVTRNANRLDSIMASVFFAFSNLFYESGITGVIVQGDTTTALAVAMSANHNGMRVIHLEAGLRTYDNNNPWPEEQNRRQISAIASVHLCPTPENAEHLINEKVLGDVFITGNTAIDNLPRYPKFYSNTVLVTMHRRENLLIMDEWFKAINQLAESNPDLLFVLPLHPNPDVQKHKHLLESVEVRSSQSHETFLTLLSDCRLIITDSGGIQGRLLSIIRSVLSAGR